MNFYPFSVAVGATFEQPVTGAFIRYWKCTAGNDNPAIRIVTDNNSDTLQMPGDSNRFKPFGRITIRNYDAVQTISGIIQVGDADEDATSNQTTGQVSVIDGGKSDTIANAAFFGFAQKGAAGAGQYSHIQLLNPSGSAKRIILTAWLHNVLSASNGSAYLTFYHTALGTLVGNGKSKYAGGADSVAELRTGSDTGGLGTQIFSKAGQGICAIDMSQWKQPVVLAPGKGIAAFWDQANISISASPEWKEESNS